MRRFILCGLCLALLAGCSPQANTEKPEGPPVMKLELPPVYESVTSIPLENAEPYSPWVSMETDTAAPDTMGEILCDTRLPDGRSVVCYWEPGSDYTKYWAIRQADGTLQRFCQEYSAYTEGYSAEPFSDILGQDGFRITAPRGAAYTAYDYYTLADSGTPRLLADCANDVIESDLNGDGERELLWFYHAGRDIFYLFCRSGEVCCLCLSDLLAQQAEPWLVFAASLNAPEDSCLPVTAAQGGWETFTPETELLPGRLRFAAEAVYLELETTGES